MKRYKVTWDNTSTDGNFPLSASFNDIDEVYDCLRAMYDNALNVSFDNAELMYKLGLMYSGDLDEFRLRRTAVSDDWVKAEYDNIAGASAFYTFGAVAEPRDHMGFIVTIR